MRTFRAASGARPLRPTPAATMSQTPKAAATLAPRMMAVMPRDDGDHDLSPSIERLSPASAVELLEVAPHRVPPPAPQPVGDLPLRLLPKRDRGTDRPPAFLRDRSQPHAAVLTGAQREEPGAAQGLQVTGERGAVHAEHASEPGERDGSRLLQGDE